jgi:hypothetical protein
MENHTFGDPVPVVHYSISSHSSNDVEHSDQQSEVEPSWTVDVIRKGSNVVVGTIVINNTKLPPRRNKNKKVVWKLPASNNTNTEEDIPRFGKQDYPRLWEIYKEEKKKRRSLNKTTDTNISSNNNIDDASSIINDDDKFTKNKSDRNDCNDDHGYVDESIEDMTNSKIPSIDHSHNSNADREIQSRNQAATVLAIPSMAVIAPPPGFESTLTLSPINDKSNGCNTHDDRFTSTSTIRPPPGFS